VRADNSEHLRAAATRRSQDVRQRIHDALQSVVRTGTNISVTAIATEAGVSRQSIYNQKDVCAEIQRLRHQQHKRVAPITAPPSSDASWQARVQTLNDRVRRVEDENRALRARLQQILGQQREPNEH